MQNPRASRVTLYIEEGFKAQIDRLWNNLMALDFSIDEVHEKAGVIQGEWLGTDASVLERVPGITAVKIQVASDDEDDKKVLKNNLHGVWRGNRIPASRPTVAPALTKVKQTSATKATGSRRTSRAA